MSDILVLKEFMDSLTLTNDKSIMPRRDECSDWESGRRTGSGVHRKTRGESVLKQGRIDEQGGINSLGLLRSFKDDGSPWCKLGT